MARAIALTWLTSPRVENTLRFAVITACTLALVGAGPSLPF